MQATDQMGHASAKSEVSSETGNPPPLLKTHPPPASLENLQTEEQRRVLDTVERVRKCGLEGELSLPQLVVCGDQSAGKSSVLEALTEIPFPRNDNLCTRYATEISLRRALSPSLTISVIPDETRPASEQAVIKAFKESITNFDELPTVMDAAMAVMGITNDNSASSDSRAFARDTLSIISEGPTNPQLTLVDIPGLIGAATRGVSDDDIDLVASITQHYISKPRTICLAVVAASGDYATQTILKRVRDVDPDGSRTLGIITKPDRIEGLGSKQAFLELAQNQDIKFKLGWHVLKNRSFIESDCTLAERKASEAKWFREEFFKALPANSVGIDALRRRLSSLLFEHVKKELPALREELEDKLKETESELKLMGVRRATALECKEYLTQLSLEFYEISKAAVNGHYEGAYFHKTLGADFDISSPSSPATLCRTRAVVQALNTEFSEIMRKRGHKYHIHMDDDDDVPHVASRTLVSSTKIKHHPISLNRDDSLKWARQLLTRTRGKELVGNFNPLLIGELFWEQSSKWEKLAAEHVMEVAQVAHDFLDMLLREKCPLDVQDRVWESIKGRLNDRRNNADTELKRIMEDLQSYPINYNHYYTNTIAQRRQERQQSILAKCAEEVGEKDIVQFGSKCSILDVDELATAYSNRSDTDMENFSCEEALDCLLAIYKVSQKTFVANVTTQVIERHLIRGLETIFSPIVVTRLTDEQAEALASEPGEAQRERTRLEQKVSMLREGYEAFRSAMGVTVR